MQRACSRHQAIGLVPSSFNVTSRDSGLGCWRRGLTRRTHTKAGLPAANAPTKNKGETRRAWINGSQRAPPGLRACVLPRQRRVAAPSSEERGMSIDGLCFVFRWMLRCLTPPPRLLPQYETTEDASSYTAYAAAQRVTRFRCIDPIGLRVESRVSHVSEGPCNRRRRAVGQGRGWSG